MVMESLTARLEAGDDLAASDIEAAAATLLDEGADVGARACFLAALARKGETADEIAAFVRAFLGHAVDPGIRAAEVEWPLLDVCGTGGDRLNLFNVSTTAMFVVAAGGVGVVKHGNRGITSRSGGADVLEAAGVRIDLPPGEFREAFLRNGIGFMLAPVYHPAFKAVAPVRKLLAEGGQRTIFNLIGPLLNPVQPPFQMVGVFDRGLCGTIAGILARLGRERAWAVWGDAGDGRGMDELSTLGTSRVCEVRRDEVSESELDPESLGLERPRLEDLQGGDAACNAAILQGILEGTIRDARRDLVLLNAAAGLVIAGRAASMPDGLSLAAELVDRGDALARLDAMRGR